MASQEMDTQAWLPNADLAWSPVVQPHNRQALHMPLQIANCLGSGCGHRRQMLSSMHPCLRHQGHLGCPLAPLQRINWLSC